VLDAGGEALEGLLPAKVGGHVGVGVVALAGALAELAGGLPAQAAQLDGAGIDGEVAVEAVGGRVAGVVEGEALPEAGAVGAGEDRVLVGVPLGEELGDDDARARGFGGEGVAVGVPAHVGGALAGEGAGEAEGQVAQGRHLGVEDHRRGLLAGRGVGGTQAHVARGRRVADPRVDDVDEGGDRLEGVGVEHPGDDQHRRVVDEADLLAVLDDRVDLRVVEVRQREQVLALAGVEVDAAAQQLDEGVEGVARDVARGVELEEVVLVVDVDEGLVLGRPRDAGAEQGGEAEQRDQGAARRRAHRRQGAGGA
jgi:hypothetical protein